MVGFVWKDLKFLGGMWFKFGIEIVEINSIQLMVDHLIFDPNWDIIFRIIVNFLDLLKFSKNFD